MPNQAITGLEDSQKLFREFSPNFFDVHFITDTSGVFDEIAFTSTEAATEALVRNGFKRFAEQPDLQTVLRAPSPPFHHIEHPNGPIYSSGRYWRP